MAQRIYIWRAEDEEQRLHRGEIVARDPHSVRSWLIGQGLVPVGVESGPKIGARSWPLSALAPVTRQLATMLQAGLPLVECLGLLAESHPHGQWRYLLSQIQRDVAQGTPFSQALARYPQAFSPLFCRIVAVSELTGELDLCCIKLADRQERALKLRAEVNKALRYPLFILAVAAVVAALMLIFVLPEFADIYRSFDAELPAFTRLVVALSESVRRYGFAALGALAVCIGGYVKYCRPKPHWQRREQAIMLKIPIVKRLLAVSYLARIFNALAVTQSAGIVLPEGLGAAAAAVNHFRYRSAVLNIKRSVEQGQSLYLSLRECGLMPPLACQIVHVGEQSGSLDAALLKLADMYERQAEAEAERLSQTLEPALMLTLGIVVGGLVIAMYLPIFQLGNIMG